MRVTSKHHKISRFARNTPVMSGGILGGGVAVSLLAKDTPKINTIAPSAPTGPAVTRTFSGSGAIWSIDGFGMNTRICTAFGATPAQFLKVGDMVRTRDGAFRRVSWVDHVKLNENFMRQHPQAGPILIRAGALGHNMPERDMEISPCHRLTEMRFSGAKTVSAESLLGRPNITRAARSQASYIRFRCEGGEAIVKAENIWTVIKG